MNCNGCDSRIEDFHSDQLFTWCTNCGNYGINAATKRALVAENIAPKDVILSFDIGCNGNGADKIGGYRFHGLHGRALPFACGAAIANKDVKVIASAGDGALMSEGITHLVHSIRNNYDVTLIIHNNSNYALTTGQASSTTKQGFPMNGSPDGVSADTLNILQFVLGLNPSFVARTFTGDVKQMTELFRAGIKHKGFSVIEVLQYCPTYNKATPHKWYQDRVYDTITIPDYDNKNLEWAKKISADLEEKIATGVLYINPDKPTFSDRQANRVNITTELTSEVSARDISSFIEKMK